MIVGSIMRHYALIYEQPIVPAKRVMGHRPPVGNQPLKSVFLCDHVCVCVCVCVCETDRG